MQNVFFRFFSILFLTLFTASSHTQAIAPRFAHIDLLIERAKECTEAGAQPVSLVFRGVNVEHDLFEIRVILITCDEAYFWYEGVCDYPGERHTIAFSSVDGSLLRGPKGCAPEAARE